MIERDSFPLFYLLQPFVEDWREPYGPGYIGADKFLVEMHCHDVPPITVALVYAIIITIFVVSVYNRPYNHIWLYGHPSCAKRQFLIS